MTDTLTDIPTAVLLPPPPVVHIAGRRHGSGYLLTHEGKTIWSRTESIRKRIKYLGVRGRYQLHLEGGGRDD